MCITWHTCTSAGFNVISRATVVEKGRRRVLAVSGPGLYFRTAREWTPCPPWPRRQSYGTFGVNKMFYTFCMTYELNILKSHYSKFYGLVFNLWNATSCLSTFQLYTRLVANMDKHFCCLSLLISLKFDLLCCVSDTAVIILDYKRPEIHNLISLNGRRKFT